MLRWSGHSLRVLHLRGSPSKLTGVVDAQKVDEMYALHKLADIGLGSRETGNGSPRNGVLPMYHSVESIIMRHVPQPCNCGTTLSWKDDFQCCVGVQVGRPALSASPFALAITTPHLDVATDSKVLHLHRERAHDGAFLPTLTTCELRAAWPIWAKIPFVLLFDCVAGDVAGTVPSGQPAMQGSALGSLDSRHRRHRTVASMDVGTKRPHSHVVGQGSNRYLTAPNRCADRLRLGMDASFNLHCTTCPVPCALVHQKNFLSRQASRRFKEAVPYYPPLGTPGRGGAGKNNKRTKSESMSPVRRLGRLERQANTETNDRHDGNDRNDRNTSHWQHPQPWRHGFFRHCSCGRLLCTRPCLAVHWKSQNLSIRTLMRR
jgi:hypothetical protein